MPDIGNLLPALYAAKKYVDWKLADLEEQAVTQQLASKRCPAHHTAPRGDTLELSTCPVPPALSVGVQPNARLSTLTLILHAGASFTSIITNASVTTQVAMLPHAACLYHPTCQAWLSTADTLSAVAAPVTAG